MNDLLRGKTIFAETSECELSCIIVVDNDDADVARKVIEQARNTWFNYDTSYALEAEKCYNVGKKQ